MRLATATLFLLSFGFTSVVAVPTPMPELDGHALALQMARRDVDSLHLLLRRMDRTGQASTSGQGQSSGGSSSGGQAGQAQQWRSRLHTLAHVASTMTPNPDGRRNGGQGVQNIPIQYTPAVAHIPVTEGSRPVTVRGGTLNPQAAQGRQPSGQTFGTQGGRQPDRILASTENLQRGDITLPPPPSAQANRAAQGRQPSGQIFGIQGGRQPDRIIASTESLQRGDLRLPPPPSTQAGQRAAALAPARAPGPAPRSGPVSRSGK